jgi:hypothetical protein
VSDRELVGIVKLFSREQQEQLLLHAIRCDPRVASAVYVNHLAMAATEGAKVISFEQSVQSITNMVKTLDKMICKGKGNQGAVSSARGTIVPILRLIKENFKSCSSYETRYNALYVLVKVGAAVMPSTRDAGSELRFKLLEELDLPPAMHSILDRMTDAELVAPDVWPRIW